MSVSDNQNCLSIILKCGLDVKMFALALKYYIPMLNSDLATITRAWRRHKSRLCDDWCATVECVKIGQYSMKIY